MNISFWVNLIVSFMIGSFYMGIYNAFVSVNCCLKQKPKKSIRTVKTNSPNKSKLYENTLSQENSCEWVMIGWFDFTVWEFEWEGVCINTETLVLSHFNSQISLWTILQVSLSKNSSFHGLPFSFVLQSNPTWMRGSFALKLHNNPKLPHIHAWFHCNVNKQG